MSYNVFDELYLKIKEKLNSEDVINQKDEISAYTLNLAISWGMTPYNKILIDELAKKIKSINNRIDALNFFKMKLKNKIPYLYKVCPTINEEEEKYIEIFFTNGYSNRSIGKVIIDKNMSIKFDYFSDEYDKEKVLNFLKEYQDIYEVIFNTLATFQEQYPNTPYQWNNHCKAKSEEIDDGFNVIYFDLERAGNPTVSFSNQRDIEIAKTHSKKYGELYDYVDYYKKTISRKMKVNINELNPLYQTIARKQIELYGDFTKTTEIKKLSLSKNEQNN